MAGYEKKLAVDYGNEEGVDRMETL